MKYLDFLRRKDRSYSVLNTHKAMLLQTLPLLSYKNDWCGNCPLICRYMRGMFLNKPPRPRYSFTWDVSVALSYLKSLYPLKNLKLFTFKCAALIALASAPRSQTIASLNLNYMIVN